MDEHMRQEMGPIKKAWLKEGFDQKKREELYHRMIALRDTGMPIEEVLEHCYKVASEDGEKPKAKMALILEDVLAKKLDGSSLAEAFSAWLPTDDLMIIEAVQDSTYFSKGLLDYLVINEKKRKIKRTIIAGSIMPLIMISLTIGMAYYFGAVVVPMIEESMPSENWRGMALFLKGFGFFAQNMAIPIVLVVAAVVGVIVSLLPKWAGAGRTVADRFPIFSTYKVYTGISFLVALSSLTSSGVDVEDSLLKLKKRSNPYVRHRIDLIYANKMNGDNLGAAMHRSGTDWPDRTMNLSIKIFAETRDISSQLSRLATSWVDESQLKVTRNMAIVSFAGLILVFSVLLGFMGGTFSLNNQVTAAAGTNF